MTRPTLTLNKPYLRIKPEELVDPRYNPDGDVQRICWSRFYAHPVVVAAGIESLMDDYMDGAWATWLKAHRNAVHYYAADREDFSAWLGMKQAKEAGKKFAYLEDLS